MIRSPHAFWLGSAAMVIAAAPCACGKPSSSATTTAPSAAPSAATAAVTANGVRFATPGFAEGGVARAPVVLPSLLPPSTPPSALETPVSGASRT